MKGSFALRCCCIYIVLVFIFYFLSYILLCIYCSLVESFVSLSRHNCSGRCGVLLLQIIASCSLHRLKIGESRILLYSLLYFLVFVYRVVYILLYSFICIFLDIMYILCCFILLCNILCVCVLCCVFYDIWYWYFLWLTL